MKPTNIQTTLDSLEKNKFTVKFFENSQAAIAELLSSISTDETIGFGGSQTLTNLNLQEKFIERGNTIFCHHQPGLSAEQKMQIRRQQLLCDVFLTSSNAITESGQLYNVDGTGQRVAAMIFGPKKVIVIAGVNKIVKDLNAARTRVCTIASPLNNKRLSMPNPCVQTGYCVNCQLPSRICNATTIIEKKPSTSDIHVWIINESLGY